MDLIYLFVFNLIELNEVDVIVTIAASQDWKMVEQFGAHRFLILDLIKPAINKILCRRTNQLLAVGSQSGAPLKTEGLYYLH